jgi:hypothetical protein
VGQDTSISLRASHYNLGVLRVYRGALPMKTSELTGVALDWAVAKCKGMLEPEPKTATWNEVKDLPIPFKLYEVTDVYNNNKFIKCVVSDITVTRCGIDESVAATAPSVTFTDAHNRQARGSIQNYFLTEKDAIAEALLGWVYPIN